MRSLRKGFILISALVIVSMTSCSLSRSKSGCPANGKSIGAERILSGEKVPKAKKFKA
jgi:hypothetical protein